MATLEGFRSKDFLDQITILNDIAGSKDPLALSGLIDLFENPTGDTGVDYMVVGVLNSVLGTSESAVVQGLGSNSQRFRTLCIRTAGEYAFASAAAPLIGMAGSETDPDLLIEILAALAKIRPAGGNAVFRAFLNHEDHLLAAMAMEMAGVYADAAALPALQAALSAAEASENFEHCDITTWKAIDSLAAIATPESLRFLVENVHHKNPTARRIITDALVRLGETVLPYLDPVYSTGSTDDRILACNIAGFIGQRKGADALVRAFDAGHFTDPNVRYAAFEALGRIGTLKGLVCLVDGLEENDELILMAVVVGLERHAAPGVLKTISERISAGTENSPRICRAIIAARALRLFQELYKDELVGDHLIDALRQSQDQDILDAFAQRLVEIGSDRSQADAANLPRARVATRKALAVDDSKSMLALYRRILTDLGFEPLLAANGQEAYAYVENGEFADVVITDMNMPIMDGVELVSKLRGSLGYDEVPIIMVTTESENSQRDVAAKVGVNAFITKPFKPGAIKALMRDLLGD
ncbi:MAG: response regulator [Humidesulfovibrio sp.]|jgi:CheY-like chemotaxis protein|uniref:response regulator n=1 Tax=Humidesulfovibrio sp. TaxID=2910988 RepID=UPI002735B81E|nr:response regulator [Humidesulfovibrio sp.]MDP2848598.1 response regulator [Humidesulfovibrio sp.]